ncbi:anion transporter [Acidibrevibacterium fodinaquatile]|uniref:anion transporter n=1 Tax=Acidibrevibacterium fodinaquatile TaxID=1969806 RepID=UPI000E0D5628|nr:anion transporter [Acidibrevibacterium fodinaquatile]
MDFSHLAALLIFTATYGVVAFGRLPFFRIDRTGAAFLGAALMLACGVLSREAAYRAIDLDTIALLLGMMIVVASLRLGGGFRLIAGWAVARAHHPLLLLAVVVLVAGVLSAFMVNDTICLVMTPLVLDVARRLGRRPQPYLIAIATASNIGSVATITGNPQNMIIGSVSQISYRAFASALAPVAAIGLLLTMLLIALVWRREFFVRVHLHAEGPRGAVIMPLVGKTLIVLLGLIAALFAGVPPAEAAVVAGGIMLLTGGLKPRRFYAEIDWPLLLMFAGLFIVVAGLQAAFIGPRALAMVATWHLDRTAPLAIVVAVLSNIVSNVPAVLVLRPFIDPLADPQHAWLITAMAATLAGNFTLLGSVANLIVVQGAASAGIRVGFWEYFVIGAPLTVLTLLVGIWWL